MKTLSCTLGLLLLLTVYCSTATSNAASGTAHAQCCFKFFMGRIPAWQIVSVTKTHSRCHDKGFIITDARGRNICVRQNLPWAQKAFEQQQVNIESTANPDQGNSKSTANQDEANAASGTAPGQCCFEFVTEQILPSQIISVVKTDSRCHDKGFIITDAKGRDVCVGQNLPWAQKAFEQQQLNIESTANQDQANPVSVRAPGPCCFSDARGRDICLRQNLD